MVVVQRRLGLRLPKTAAPSPPPFNSCFLTYPDFQYPGWYNRLFSDWSVVWTSHWIRDQNSCFKTGFLIREDYVQRRLRQINLPLQITYCPEYAPGHLIFMLWTICILHTFRRIFKLVSLSTIFICWKFSWKCLEKQKHDAKYYAIVCLVLKTNSWRYIKSLFSCFETFTGAHSSQKLFESYLLKYKGNTAQGIQKKCKGTQAWDFTPVFFGINRV